MSFSSVLRKEDKLEMDEFEKILLFMALGTNTLSLPSQNEHPVTERDVQDSNSKFSII